MHASEVVLWASLDNASLVTKRMTKVPGDMAHVIHVIPFEVFINSQQYKNDNIANFVLALPLKMNKTNEGCNFKIQNPVIFNFIFPNCTWIK